MNIVKLQLKKWKFNLGDIEEAWYKGFDDRAWRQVYVPHDWSIEHPFSKSCSSGTGYVEGGIGWYRVKFSLPEEYKGKTIRVCFDGVYKNAQVWVNSYYQGKHPYGYTPFSYDISDIACFGDVENEISVKVTHTDLADSRWFTGSGIYRKVFVEVLEPVAPAEYGVVFKTLSVDGDSARVAVSHKISSRLAEEKELVVETELVDENGQVVFAGSVKTSTLAKSAEIKGIVKNAKLWSDVTPNLYTMNSYYTLDSVRSLVDSQRVGIRTFEFNGDTGFSLNGVPTIFKGVCVHHDGGSLGAAMTKDVWRRRLEALKESGCNAIRCSHNPHMPELYELCDEMGFLMMDEAFDEWENAKNKWSTGHNVYPPRHQGYFEDFPQWHDADLRAMVRRDINHPSIILWSIGNEIDYPNDPYAHPSFETMTGNNDHNKPEAERLYDSNKPNMERLIVIAKELVDIVKEEDDSRPVTLAAAFPELSSKLGLSGLMDVVSFNYKEHIYEEVHAMYPDKAFLGSENGHHQEAWDSVLNVPYNCGQFLWTGIDYLGEAHGWPIRGSWPGYITSAGFKKENYYTRSKMWGGEKSTYVRSKKNPVDFSINLYSSPCCDEPEDGYIYQILLDSIDEDGVLSDVSTEYMAQVAGAGMLVSMDNGNMADLRPYSDNVRKSFDGHLVIYVRRINKGAIKVFVTNEAGIVHEVEIN